MRFLKFRLTTQKDETIRRESSWLTSNLLLQTAPDGTTTTDKRRKVYARGYQIRAGH